MNISVKDLLKSINTFRISGDLDRYVSKVAPIDKADHTSLCFYVNENVEGIQRSDAEVVICSNKLKYSIEGKTLIYVADPRLAFIRLLKKYFIPAPKPPEIGKGTKIHKGVHIYPDVKIGKRVIIHSGTVIGSDGFGFVKNEKGEWEKFPHIGGVIIEDDVEIQANCTIARGALVNTVIGGGTKLDNVVHIAHQDQIGKNCYIAAGAIFGGSVKLGDNCWVGLNVTIRDWITIGSNVLIGMGSVVTKDIGDDVVIMGAPAREIRKNIIGAEKDAK